MKNLPFSVFHIIFCMTVFLLIILIVFPFNLINMEQAYRIAKWKSVYENLKYSFDLVNLHEGNIIPDEIEAGKVITDEYIMERFMPYFNVKSKNIFNPYKKRYGRFNSSAVVKSSQYYFDKFVQLKDGCLISVKKNPVQNNSKKQPLYYMFIDVNGIEKPNKIGQDIFLINVFKDKISPMGEGKSHASLKANCSPVSSGIYCSQYYLMGGRF